MATKFDTPSTANLIKGIIAGLPNLPSTVTSFAVLGPTSTVATLTSVLQGYQALFDASAKADAAQAAAAEALAAVEPTATPFVAATKAALKAALGRKSMALETVGVTPDKTPTPLTPEQEVAKVAKAAATRAARHTMGAKQKAKIKGQVPPAGTPPAAPGH